jgi:hypothetical protein
VKRSGFPQGVWPARESKCCELQKAEQVQGVLLMSAIALEVAAILALAVVVAIIVEHG